MSQRGATQEEQEQIMLAHQKDLQNLINKMDADKLRMQSNLQDRLRKRREEKLVCKQRDMEEEAGDAKREMAERQRAESDRQKADEVRGHRVKSVFGHVVKGARGPGSKGHGVEMSGGQKVVESRLILIML